MAFEQSDKENILESLMSVRRQGQLAELNLRFQGESEEADSVWGATARLSTEIDILIGRMMQDWLGSAKSVKKSIESLNSKIETAASDIKKQTRIAQNVVKVVGLLDDGVDLAKKAIAGR